VSPLVSRTLTIVAAAVLAFDGAALAVLGFWSGRVVLALVGIAFFVASGLVLFYWRWYRRRLEDIAEARRALGDDAREMQRLLREK
jgi:membrane protein implicated in regulation of membrane protease activity